MVLLPRRDVALIFAVVVLVVSEVLRGSMMGSIMVWIPDVAPPSLQEPSIPHRLAFNFKNNLWAANLTTLRGNKPELRMAQNVRRTVRLFEQAWNETSVTVHFRNNTDCEQLIERSAPELLSHYRTEIGMHQSDICRIVDLQQHGGYYMDKDMSVLEVPRMLPHMSGLPPSWSQETSDSFSPF